MSATTADEYAPTLRPRWPRVLALGTLLVLLLAGGLVAGTVPRATRDRAVRERAAAAATQPPRVAVATATRVAADAMRVLPGTCLPLTEAAIYPRTTGYVTRRAVDIGDRVKAGQVLAEIATPEVDAQLDQARATLAQNAANLVRTQAQELYTRAQVRREQKAFESGAESRDLYDSAVANSAVATATVRATEATLKVDEANIRRLETMQSFQKVTAPFDGIITARNVDQGALVQADSPAAVRELFHLMRTDVVRVWVNVPQTFSTAFKPGQKAAVYRREDPARIFTGTMVRTADALDPNSRTLLAEIHVPNPNNTLRPGMYLQVKFTFDRDVFPVTIPAAAVVIRTEAPTVGVLDASNTVHYRKVQLGRDYGAALEVTVGLNPGDVVVVRPGDELPEGTVVEPVAQPGK